MMRQIGKIIAVIMLFVMLSACSASIEEEQSVAKETVSNVFTNESTIKANHENDGIKYFLPDGAVIKKTAENNIVFEKNSKMFILFINPHEGPESEIVYQSSVSPDITYRVNETFQKDNQFGFMLVNDIPENEDLYELTVGVGGVKVTTETDAKHLSDDAELMMEIATTVEK